MRARWAQRPTALPSGRGERRTRTGTGAEPVGPEDGAHTADAAPGELRTSINIGCTLHCEGNPSMLYEVEMIQTMLPDDNVTNQKLGENFKNKCTTYSEIIPYRKKNTFETDCLENNQTATYQNLQNTKQ